METNFKKFRALTYEGVSSSAMTSITSRFLPLLALHLGASNAAIGGVVSIPAAFSLLGYLPAAIMVESMKKVKRFCALTSFISRFIWLVVAFLPFLPFIGDSVSMLILLASVSSLAGAFINPAWATLLGNIVPSNVRGRYFGMKDRLSGIVSLTLIFVSGYIVDFLGNEGGFFVLFLIAGLAGVMTSLFFMMVDEPVNQTVESTGTIREMKKVISNKSMRRFLLSILIWQFGVYLASPFFNVYLIQEVGAPYSWLSILMVASGVGGILMFKAWGTFSDRFGPRQAIVFSAVGATAVPILWFISTSLDYLIAVEFMSGVVWAGLNMALFAYLFEISRDGRRSLYSALYMTVMGLPVVVAPIVGGYIADAVTIPLFGGVTGIRSSLLVSFIVRVVGLVFFIKFLMETPLRQKVTTRFITNEILNVGRYHATLPFVFVKKGSFQLAMFSYNALAEKISTLKGENAWKVMPSSARKELMQLEKEMRSLENKIRVVEMEEENVLESIIKSISDQGKKLNRILSSAKKRKGFLFFHIS